MLVRLLSRCEVFRIGSEVVSRCWCGVGSVLLMISVVFMLKIVSVMICGSYGCSVV